MFAWKKSSSDQRISAPSALGYACVPLLNKPPMDSDVYLASGTVFFTKKFPDGECFLGTGPVALFGEFAGGKFSRWGYVCGEMFRVDCAGCVSRSPCMITGLCVSQLRFAPPWLTHRHTDRQVIYDKLSQPSWANKNFTVRLQPVVLCRSFLLLFSQCETSYFLMA